MKNPLSVTLLLFVAGLGGCGNDGGAAAVEERLRPVKTLTVGNSHRGIRKEFPGVIDALQKADLSFRVSGKLAALLVKESGFVNKGLAIARLDGTDYRIQLEARQASYEQARADLERAEGLVTQQYLSKSDYDSLKAQYSAAKAELDTARQNLAYTTLHAPFSGLIARHYVENFEDITAAQPICSLQDLSALTVKVNIPETFMVNVRRGNDAPIFAVFESIPGKKYPLSFKEVTTQPDAATKTYEVTFVMAADSEHTILPGMSVNVIGEQSPAQSGAVAGIYVPAATVLEDRSGRFVYIAQPGENHRALVERRTVTTGKISSLGLEIVSGLTPGDRVVTAGMSKMREGLKVRLIGGESQ